MRVAECWTDCVEACGGEAVTGWLSGEELERRYGEGHRRYHDLAHIEQVVAAVERLLGALALPDSERRVILLAALAHDVVYSGQPGSDEDESAAWAGAHLSAAGVPDEVAARVTALIRGTAEHRADPEDLLAAVLYDADLSILGSEPSAYDAYAVRVRQEYAFVPEEDWRTGRAAVLQDLLGREVLYVTEQARLWWDEAARANLQRELARLSGG